MRSGAKGASALGGLAVSRFRSDDQLARRAAAGDRRAFAAIFERYEQDLYRFCLAIARNPQDAQDALQSTMLKALSALPGEKREIKLKPWLYRVAHNEAVDVLRRRRDSGPLAPETAAASMDIAATVEARQRLRKLLADLAELPERQRAALVLRELAGLGFSEIAEVFGSTAAVARQTVYEARLGLREMEEGREMTCAELQRRISAADGRLLRRRDVRAHLRGCADCRDFATAIETRREDLAMISPLPLAAAASLVSTVLGGSGGAGSGAAATLAGKGLATSALVKSLGAAAVIAVGVGAADRAGLVHAPFTDGRSTGAQSRAAGSATGGGRAPNRGGVPDVADRQAGRSGIGVVAKGLADRRALQRDGSALTVPGGSPASAGGRATGLEDEGGSVETAGHGGGRGKGGGHGSESQAQPGGHSHAEGHSHAGGQSITHGHSHGTGHSHAGGNQGVGNHAHGGSEGESGQGHPAHSATPGSPSSPPASEAPDKNGGPPLQPPKANAGVEANAHLTKEAP